MQPDSQLEAAAGNAWRGLQFLNEAKQLEADGDHDAAERSYSQAMDRVAHPDVLASFANFLQTVRGEHSRAESMFQLSLRTDPTHLDTLQYYAIFLEEVRGDLDAAERLYTVALESTRDGLLNEIETPTMHVSEAETEPLRFLPPALSPGGGELIQPVPSPEHRTKKSANKIRKGDAENQSARDQVRLRQSPKRESLKQHLQHGTSDLATSGSSRGRVDAERRFTDGSFCIADETFAGTRHRKAFKGQIHAQPWMGPLDTAKRGKDKPAVSRGRADKTEVVGGPEGATRSSSFRCTEPKSPEDVLRTAVSIGESFEDLGGWGRSENIHGDRGWIGKASNVIRGNGGAHKSYDLDAISDLGTPGHIRASRLVGSHAGAAPQQAGNAESMSLRYDPQLRLKVRQTFSSLEHLQHAGVIISHPHICSMVKNTLDLHLTRDMGAKLVRHFLTRPGARLSSTHEDDRRARYDAFAEDIWRAMANPGQVLQSRGASASSEAQVHALLEGTVDTLPAPKQDYANTDLSKAATRVSLKSWLQEARSLGRSAMPELGVIDTASSSMHDAAYLRLTAAQQPDSYSSQKQFQASDVVRGSEISGSSHLDSLDRLMSHPGRQYDKMAALLPSFWRAPQQNDIENAADSAAISVSSGASQSGSHKSITHAGISFSTEESVRTQAQGHLQNGRSDRFVRASSAESQSTSLSSAVATPRGHTNITNNKNSTISSVVPKNLDADECFDADSMYHPACNAGIRRSSQAPTSSSRSVDADLMHPPAASSSTAPCKFEMLRPQELGSAEFGGALDLKTSPSDAPNGSCAETPQLEFNDLVSVDSLLFAVQTSLLAQGQKEDDFEKGCDKDDSQVEGGNAGGHAAFEKIEAWGATKDDRSEFDKDQRSDSALTRAEPSSSVSLRNFKRRSLSNAALPPGDHLKHVHEQIFLALRQKFHTASMIFGYLNSRAAEDQSITRGRPASSRAASARKNAIRKDDFKSAVLLLGLGLPEKDIVAVYNSNSDIRTGEFTFNSLQRAIQSICCTPNKPQAVLPPRSQTKEPKETDKIREVLKQVWSSAAQAFVFFDISGSDAINPTQLRQGLKRLRLNAVGLEAAFREIDLDRDGRISERDFIKHFAAGWHPLGDFIQTRKEYEAVKAKGRHRVAHDFQLYIDALNREDAQKSQLRVQSPLRHLSLESPLYIDSGRGGGSDQDDVEIELVLDMEFSDTIGIEDEIKSGIQRDIAFSCNGACSKVLVRGLRAGSVVVDVVLCQGLCSDGTSPLEAAKDLQQQMRDLQSSLLLCEYTCCAIDVRIKEKRPEAPQSGLSFTPVPHESDSTHRSPKIHRSPVLEGLDLHGLDGSSHRPSHAPPNFLDAHDTFPGLHAGERIRRPPPMSSSGRHRQLLAPPRLRSSSEDDVNHSRHDANLLTRATSDDTTIPDSDSRSQLDDMSDNLDDTYDEVFDEFQQSHGHSFSRSSDRAQANGKYGERISNGTADQGGSARGGKSVSPQGDSRRDAHDDYDLLRGNHAMSASEMARLRLQLKRQAEDKRRQHEKDKIAQHRIILLEKRRHKRHMQEAARVERSRLHKGTLQAAGSLRLFSRYRAFDAGRKTRADPSDEVGPLEPRRQQPRDTPLEKRPGSETPHRSVRWDRPQVRTFETSRSSEGSPPSSGGDSDDILTEEYSSSD